MNFAVWLVGVVVTLYGWGVFVGSELKNERASERGRSLALLTLFGVMAASVWPVSVPIGLSLLFISSLE